MHLAHSTPNFPSPTPQLFPSNSEERPPEPSVMLSGDSQPIHTPPWKVWVEALDPHLLQLGDSGVAVNTLQRTLHSLSLYNKPVDGYFGPETEAALQILQAILRLEPTGQFDQATWIALTCWTPPDTDRCISKQIQSGTPGK